MSARRQYSDKHALPANPTWIEFERSDGDENTWPSNTTRIVDHEGHVNFMLPLDLNGSICLKWRTEVGAAVAVALRLPDGHSYVLKDWPAKYRMFDHHKGPQATPRHDVYLMGSKFRYRSVPEFIPHAIWLMEDPTMDRKNCKCKYCSKKAQREISSSMGLLRKAGGSQSPGPRASGSFRTKVREQRKPYAAVQRAPKPLKSVGPPKHPVLRERNADIRAVSVTGTRLRRLFREGELLWCALDPPIQGKGDSDSIKFWPGLVQDVKIKSVPIPRTAGDVNMADPVDHQSSHETSDSSDDATPWTVHQSNVYRMHLLVISHSLSLSDDQVLPYQAYAPSNELIQSIQDFPWADMDLRPEIVSAFNPLPPLSSNSGSSALVHEPKFAEAVAPFALAVQISARLAGYWAVTDDWEFKFAVPPSNVVPSTNPRTGSMSLHSVITAAGSANAALQPGSISRGPPNLSGPSNITPAELDSLSTRMLGLPVPTQTITQIRYQGLWWGAEKIWTDELVRLKVARRQLAPEGTDGIYPPAGPSKKTMEHLSHLSQPLDPTSVDFGAGGRGVFMKLEGLFVVDVPKEDGTGTQKECRASGMLYELVEDDWEEPMASQSEANGQKSGESSSFQANGSGHENAMTESSQAGPSSGPSSLKPTQLPDFDPFDPVSLSVSSFLTHTNAENQAANAQLSHPRSTAPYPLPSPPTGFKFRSILPVGHEVVLSLSLISGRYYPHLLAHPLLQPDIYRVFANSLPDGGITEGNNLWALEGLSPGYFNAVDPTFSKTSRQAMMKDADKDARTEVERVIQDAKAAKMNNTLDELSMDVDG